MTLDLEIRLRRANPEPARAFGVDEELLRRVLAEPRERPTATQRIRRRPLLLLAAAVILVAGTAASVSQFAVQYFGADDSEPTPAAIVAELRRLSQGFEVDAERYVRLASFDSEAGRTTIYIAPATKGARYCVASATGSTVDGGSCSVDTVPEMKVPYGNFHSSSYGDVFPIYGRVPDGVASIEVRFEDGAAHKVSVRAPWWIYVVGGDETAAGHRPVALEARGPDGALLATQHLNKFSFSSRAAALAAIPESDGSPGQEAVRNALVAILPIGAEIGPKVRLDETRLVRTVHTSRGSFDVYAAPWGNGGLCFGYDDHRLAFEHTTTGCPYGEPSPDQPSTFSAHTIEVYADRSGFAVLDGTPPRAAAAVRVRFQDGTSAGADIFTRSFFGFWFDGKRLSPAHRPTELVALDADGSSIDTFSLDPPRLMP
ncbi:MAG TPA: hypothetical protein VE693_04575 [Gaiellaceae bacterium]|nr:hypothetical protein [Gaiellaceae bacterium]